MTEMSSATRQMNWVEANQGALSAALAVIRARLLTHSAEDQVPQIESAQQALQVAEQSLPSPSAIEMLRRLFNLSAFERDVILLCAGMELEAVFASACATAHGDPQKPYPTFSLALAALPEAHWSALKPDAPLRRWHLVEFASPAGASGSLVSAPLTTRPLRIDERVLHYLTGIQHTDERLAGALEPLRPSAMLMPAHQETVERIVSTWKRAVGTSLLPVVGLYGADAESARAIAAHACQLLGMGLQAVPAHLLPTAQSELQTFIRLWEREAALSACALLIDCNDDELSETNRESAVSYVIEKTRGAIFVVSRERRRSRQRTMASFEVSRPATSEQRTVWQAALGPMAARLDGHLHPLMSQFSLNPLAIQAAVSEAAIHLSAQGAAQITGEDIFASLWDACRNQTRTRLDDLAQKIAPAAEWDELVLPVAQKEILREIVSHVRHRAKVYEEWGFAKKGARGLGISALFAGASGTGKTMAAEVLANELRLDLYRIDLSSVVSKYIGETEKNLRRVFDAAEAGGAILLFDEADALFGKRSEVKDSHDRYANIEVGYLLQRIESYRGLAILTTNLKSSLDQAFLRRIRFVVQFPFPDAEQRAEIWRRIYPANMPTTDLDLKALAQVNVAGGNIRSIALNAAFIAAEAGIDLEMQHLLTAVKSEYAKLEKHLTEAEIAGWD